MNLYLKYRPKTFSDVVGQSHVVDIIKNSIQKGNNSHAYLLVGTRGTGKTTIGRLIAKALNCAKSGCGICKICTDIQNGVFPDLIEIDAASNRGIDNIRGLKEQVSYSPQYKTKIYIIDECHMLTKEASNALLKVLEEPPAGVVFVLCTTEEDKILPTIKSRCQVHNLFLLSKDAIKLQLLRIANEEGIKLDISTADFIALQAKGSMRDGISLLDKFRDLEVLDVDNVKKNLGLSDQSTLIEFIEFLARKKPGKLFLILDELAKSGANLEIFVSDVEEFLQNINYKNSGFDNSTYKFYSEVETIHGLFTTEFLIKCFDSLSKWRTRYLPFSKLNLEVAISEICLNSEQSKTIAKVDEMPMDWMTLKPKPITVVSDGTTNSAGKPIIKKEYPVKEEEDDF